MSNWRKTREYRTWRAHVIRRDKRCLICGTIKNRHAHHLDHASYFISLRFRTFNGVCLCKDCHMNFHCNFKNSYREKCTQKDFLNFAELFKYLFSVSLNYVAKNIKIQINEVRNETSTF